MSKSVSHSSGERSLCESSCFIQIWITWHSTRYVRETCEDFNETKDRAAVFDSYSIFTSVSYKYFRFVCSRKFDTRRRRISINPITTTDTQLSRSTLLVVLVLLSTATRVDAARTMFDIYIYIYTFFFSFSSPLRKKRPCCVITTLRELEIFVSCFVRPYKHRQKRQKKKERKELKKSLPKLYIAKKSNPRRNSNGVWSDQIFAVMEEILFRPGHFVAYDKIVTCTKREKKEKNELYVIYVHTCIHTYVCACVYVCECV